MVIVTGLEICFTVHPTNPYWKNVLSGLPTTGKDDPIQAELTVNKEHIQLYEGNTCSKEIEYEINVTDFSCTINPVHAMILFDRTGSMADDSRNPPEPLTT